MSKWKMHLVERKHVLAAVKRWVKRKPKEYDFGKSTTFDVIVDNKTYPPKAIGGIAYSLATGATVSSKDFAGAADGVFHHMLEDLGFPVLRKEYSTQADKLRKLSLAELEALAQAEGRKEPDKFDVITVRFARSSAVVAAALARARSCERCGQVPFRRKRNNEPYLEVHHKIPLSMGGADTLDNTIALCPNCHAQVHDLAGWDVSFE